MINFKKNRVSYLLYIIILFVLGYLIGKKIIIDIKVQKLIFDILNKCIMIVLIIEMLFLTIGVMSVSLRELETVEKKRQLNYIKIVIFLIVSEVLGIIIFKLV